jgi:CelD/BcsL family acetyltransferase involved in cellulose biosynthesis
MKSGPLPQPDGLQRTEVLGPAQLGGLEDAWRRLAETRGNAFVTPEWYLAWMRHYGGQATPAIAVVRRGDGSLRGLMSMVVTGSGLRRRVRFPGAAIADRFHPAAAVVDESDVAAASFEALRVGEPGTGILELERAPVEARWWRKAGGSGSARAKVAAFGRDALPYISLGDASWEEYLGGRSRHFRKRVRYLERALHKAHRVRFRMTHSQAELHGDLETFFALHERRWRPRGGSSAVDDRSRGFHRTFAAAALMHGWLRLWFLELDGEPVAAWYGWRLGDVYSYYQAGFDPTHADLSVGFVLLAHTIRSAIKEGANEYDLLLGGEEYKRRFATGERSVQTVLVARAQHPLSIVTMTEAALWRAARRLPPRLRTRARGAYGRVRAARPHSRA